MSRDQTPPPVPKFDARMATRFLEHILDTRAGCAEICVIKGNYDRGNYIVNSDRYNFLIAGWYDNVSDMLVDLSKIRGVSAYVVINPIIHDLLARTENKLAKQAHRTKDEYVTRFRWWLLDIDPKRPEGISATDEERDAAIAVRDQILAEHPDIAASAIWGTSGNGAFILVRLPDYGTEDGNRLAIKATAWIAERYNNDQVDVDVKVTNAARLMAVVGTAKCKGEHNAKRPWRLAMLDGEAGEPGKIPGMDLEAWVKEVGADKVAGDAAQVKSARSAREVASTGSKLPAVRVARNETMRLKRAAAYLDAMKPAIMGQNGHGQTFDAACSLIHGFGLTIDQARPLLYAYNDRCQPPWTTRELEHKLQEAEEHFDSRPRGYLFDADGEDDRASGSGNAGDEDKPRFHNSVGIEGPDDPHRLARTLINVQFSQGEKPTILFHRGQFWHWDRACYRALEPDELDSQLTNGVKDEFNYVNKIEIEEWIGRGRKDLSGRNCRAPESHKVTCVLVKNVEAALRGMCIKPSRLETPAWLVDDPPFPSHEIVPCRNGLLHIPSFLEGKPALHPATPDYFGSHALDFDFDPGVGEPVRWLEFLRSVFEHDESAIEALQQWMGYLLTADTSQQKIGLFIGPKRSGKGTIARIITALIGRENVASPSMAEFGLEFGLQNVIGKPLVIVGDARVSGRQDIQMAVERLLQISGEDSVQIGRKYLPPWSGRLPARLMILSNIVPRLPDASRALPSRMLAFRMMKSWEGKEDLKLEQTLKAELPEILVWAIEGWGKLRDSGRFTQSDSGRQVIEEMSDLSSPIGTFVEERCILHPDEKIRTNTLFREWMMWCENRNMKAGTDAEFGQKLHAFDPTITRIKPRNRQTGMQEPHYSGINLAPVIPDVTPVGEQDFRAHALPNWQSGQDGAAF